MSAFAGKADIRIYHFFPDPNLIPVSRPLIPDQFCAYSTAYKKIAKLVPRNGFYAAY